MFGGGDAIGLPRRKAPPRVLRENWEAVTVFQRLWTQWERCPMTGTWLRLNYPGVDVVIRHAGCTDPDEVFAKIQLMEGDVRKILNARLTKK